MGKIVPNLGAKTNRSIKATLTVALTAFLGSGPFDPTAAAQERSQAGARQTLTARASIEIPRLEHLGDSVGGQISYSPDGKRYLVRVARDDLKAGGTWVDFYAGGTDSLESASPVRVARLFTTGRIDRRNGSTPPTHPGYTAVTWVDSDRFLFKWDPDGISQIMLGDVRTGSIEQLTHSRTSVTSFGLVPGAGGASPLIIYSLFPALPDERRAMDLPRGFAVTNTDLLNTVLIGEFSSESAWNSTTPRLLDLATRLDRPLVCSGPPCSSYALADYINRVSSSGRFMAGIGGEYEMSWRVVEVDRAGGTLVDRWPQRPSSIVGFDALWAPSEDHVIIGPVELKPGQGARFFIELDPETGQHWRLPIEVPVDHSGIISPIRSLRWRTDGIVELSRHGAILAFRKQGESWIQLSETPPFAELSRQAAPLRIEVREHYSDPPQIVAVERNSGRERLLLDVAPQLRNYTLGRVEYVEFADREGTSWEGRLTYPVGYQPGIRYPMVIAASPGEAGAQTFSLTGNNSHRGALYAAQALANRGIAVLSLSTGGTGGGARGLTGVAPSREGEKITMGFEAAVEHLVNHGIAHPDRIGLAGFSRNGGYVQQAITRSSYPFAAAISSDNVNFGYVQAILRGQIGKGDDPADVNGAPASGEGLARWLEQAPPFNAHRIRAPLRIEIVSGGVGGLVFASEMYQQLRYLRRPVDMVVVPYPRHAIHDPHMPVQKLFSQAGAVDWFDYWLNDHEDPDPEKAEQYARWRELRELRRWQHATAQQ